MDMSRYAGGKPLNILGASYAGDPRPNTAMFISKKVGHLVNSLEGVSGCLVFAESGIEVPDKILSCNCFAFSDNPQAAYAEFTAEYYRATEEKNSAIGYDAAENGALISRTAVVGDGCQIEPHVVIGPGVAIGRNARIHAGAVIMNATIGNDAVINEYAVIGGNGFTMADDEHGNKVRIYSLGRVRIGNNVEVGAHDNISRGSAGDTLIGSNVKIDALVHVGHDAHLYDNVEITAGAVIGGFVNAYERAYVGINAVIRNRISLGANCFVGMGAVVTKSVGEGVTVVGNPAKPFAR
jgi:UDP-3-O-[3-hydroxymyristoyl] glucosamine N-acyltransferase